MPHSIHLSMFLASAVVAAATFSVGASAQSSDTQYIEADGTRYAYRSFGPESAEPIVLSQRFRGNMDDWDPAFIDALDDDRRVIVFNNVGVSTTGGTVPSDIAGMADHMAQFIRALGYDNADILGWSMGGFVVQAVALRHPDLVDRLILVGTGPAGSSETPQPVEGVFDVATRAVYGEQEREYLFFADARSSQTRANASMARIDAARDAKAEPATNAEVMQAQAGAIQAWLSGNGGEFDLLSSIDSPTLIVAGDRDPFFPLQAAFLLYREIPNARLAVYPMAGHGPHHQWPEHVAAIVDDFLTDTAD